MPTVRCCAERSPCCVLAALWWARVTCHNMADQCRAHSNFTWAFALHPVAVSVILTALSIVFDRDPPNPEPAGAMAAALTLICIWAHLLPMPPRQRVALLVCVAVVVAVIGGLIAQWRASGLGFGRPDVVDPAFVQLSLIGALTGDLLGHAIERQNRAFYLQMTAHSARKQALIAQARELAADTAHAYEMAASRAHQNEALCRQLAAAELLTEPSHAELVSELSLSPASSNSDEAPPSSAVPSSAVVCAAAASGVERTAPLSCNAAGAPFTWATSPTDAGAAAAPSVARVPSVHLRPREGVHLQNSNEMAAERSAKREEAAAKLHTLVTATAAAAVHHASSASGTLSTHASASVASCVTAPLTDPPGPAARLRLPTLTVPEPRLVVHQQIRHEPLAAAPMPASTGSEGAIAD
jgi:hypothetical protein